MKSRVLRMINIFVWIIERILNVIFFFCCLWCILPRDIFWPDEYGNLIVIGNHGDFKWRSSRAGLAGLDNHRRKLDRALISFGPLIRSHLRVNSCLLLFLSCSLSLVSCRIYTIYSTYTPSHENSSCTYAIVIQPGTTYLHIYPQFHQLILTGKLGRASHV